MHDNSPNLAVRFLTAKAKRNIHYIAVLLASLLGWNQVSDALFYLVLRIKRTTEAGHDVSHE